MYITWFIIAILVRRSLNLLNNWAVHLVQTIEIFGDKNTFWVIANHFVQLRYIYRIGYANCHYFYTFFSGQSWRFSHVVLWIAICQYKHHMGNVVPWSLNFGKIYNRQRVWKGKYFLNISAPNIRVNQVYFKLDVILCSKSNFSDSIPIFSNHAIFKNSGRIQFNTRLPGKPR